jgi:hypothetical protein
MATTELLNLVLLHPEANQVRLDAVDLLAKAGRFEEAADISRDWFGWTKGKAMEARAVAILLARAGQPLTSPCVGLSEASIENPLSKGLFRLAVLTAVVGRRPRLAARAWLARKKGQITAT